MQRRTSLRYSFLVYLSKVSKLYNIGIISGLQEYHFLFLVHKRIKAEKCYCLPARNNPDKQEGEGCTKELPVEAPFIFDAANLPGVDGPPPPPPPPDYEEDEIPPPSRGWCFLGGVKDPRYYEPEEHCYDDLQWSETEQKFWSTSACDDVPPEGVPT